MGSKYSSSRTSFALSFSVIFRINIQCPTQSSRAHRKSKPLVYQTFPMPSATEPHHCSCTLPSPFITFRHPSCNQTVASHLTLSSRIQFPPHVLITNNTQGSFFQRKKNISKKKMISSKIAAPNAQTKIISGFNGGISPNRKKRYPHNKHQDRNQVVEK